MIAHNPSADPDKRDDAHASQGIGMTDGWLNLSNMRLLVDIYP
jgi:hypothetical protein